MFKKVLIILFFMMAVGARHAVPLHAQAPQTECPPECVTDSMEIITYYPSPYGYYEELRGDKIIVGDSDNSYINETNLPPTGTITFEPKSSTEISNTGTYYEGSIYYDKNDQEFKYYKNNIWQDLSPAGVPAGFVGFFNLSACPAGWSELTAAKGRYLVGLPSGGTLAGTQGTALSNLENRPVGQHNHTVNDPGHSHAVPGMNGLNSGYIFTSNPSMWGTSAAGSAVTSITINNSGSVPGTNAPYLQLLVCQKD